MPPAARRTRGGRGGRTGRAGELDRSWSEGPFGAIYRDPPIWSRSLPVPRTKVITGCES
jgi:hypothetical protein